MEIAIKIAFEILRKRESDRSSFGTAASQPCGFHGAGAMQLTPATTSVPTIVNEACKEINKILAKF